jgi:hypothetical protein
MKLEEVIVNKTQKELYLQQVITPHNHVKDVDKQIIKKILLEEVKRVSEE